MTEPTDPAPLDYASPSARSDRPGPSSPVMVGLFIVGMILGPLFLAALVGMGGGMTNSAVGALIGAGFYAVLMVSAAIAKETRWLGIGMLCGPLIAAFAFAVICGNMRI